jgi:hypothetical protein
VEEENLAISDRMRAVAVSAWVTTGIALYELAETEGPPSCYEEAAECFQRALRWGVWGGEETGDFPRQINWIEKEEDDDDDEDDDEEEEEEDDEEEEEEEDEEEEEEEDIDGKVDAKEEVQEEVETDDGPWTAFKIFPKDLTHSGSVLPPVRGRVRPYSSDLGCSCDVLSWLVLSTYLCYYPSLRFTGSKSKEFN